MRLIRVYLAALERPEPVDLLAGISPHLGALKGVLFVRLQDERYAALRHRLEDAHAAAATPVEARRRVEFDEGR